MSTDVLLPVGLLCGTVVYVLRAQGPLGRVLASLLDLLRHRRDHERYVIDRVARAEAEERDEIRRGLDAYNTRMDRQDAAIRDHERRLQTLESGGDDAA